MKLSTSPVILPDLVTIPAGSFVMGNDAGRSNERPAHTVAVGAFQAAVRPVSNAEYRAFLAATGYEAPPFIDDARFSDLKQPVVAVSWYDAVAYCRWLTAATGARFRLPAEAEREYAALGGLEGVDWPWGDETPEACAERAAIGRLDRPHTPTVACANGFGLLCMADNIHEWCSDWYDAAYYGNSPPEAPAVPASGSRRSSRGGSWRHQIKFTRLSARSSLDPSYRYNDYGFRLYADV
jgi:formylglycine-generating enzyme